MPSLVQSSPNRVAHSHSATGARRGFTILTPEFLDELRNRLTLSTVIGRTVPLKKAGNELKACCPFHQEKTPSFWVNDQKGFYHCFGCGVHGDAIRWLTDGRGMSFIEAVKQLADEVGLELPKPDPREAARQQRVASLSEVLDAAVRYFQDNLTSSVGKAARSYLDKREISQSTLEEFQIGLSLEGYGNIGRALSRFSQEQLVESGLLVQVESKEPYDRFRSRIMVPIRDPKGRTIGFGGRILGDGEPKYLNSPDTPLFDKGRVLFNLDRAAPASRQAGRVIVVEGYFDVLALSQSGIREAVAPMGTALTEAQLETLWRLTDEPIVCFDGDSAGQRAAERASHRAMLSLRPGKQLLVAILPSGKDPDDLVRSGGRAAFEQIVEQALPLSRFLYASELTKIDVERPEQRAALRKNLEELSQTCTDKLVAEEFSRSFKSQFYEDFGWKHKQRQNVFKSAVRTSPRVQPDLARLNIRSALYGLTRFPSVAASNLETLAALKISYPDLQRWRDAIGDAVVSNPNLEDDGIAAILEADVLPQTLTRDLCSDLRFGFVRMATPRDVALKQLEVLLQTLHHESVLEEELAVQDKAAESANTLLEYERIEAQRRVHRASRTKLFEEAVSWNDVLQ